MEETKKGNLRTIDEKFAQITASFVTNGYYLRRQLVLANCQYLKVGERMPNMRIDDSQTQLRFA